MQNVCRGFLRSNYSWLVYITAARRLETSRPQSLVAKARTFSNFPLNDDVKVPTSSQVVICGGGIVGSSLAYHLTKLGWKDVVLLEQGRISCGTTWHAACLIGALKNSSAESQLASYACRLYSRLEEETGLGTGWKQCGSILLARTNDRLTYLKRQHGKARTFGIECEFISLNDLEVKWPNIRTDDILAALWFPNDGVAMGTDICNSLLRGATMNGAKVYEGVSVESIKTKNNSVSSVLTNKGEIACDVFVNCAGQWGREVGMKSNPHVNVPLHATEHFYIVTKPMKDVHPMLPVLRDPDGFIYLREWNGGILAGGFEQKGKPIFYDKIPEKFEFQLLPEDWDHFEVLMNEILHRYPPMENAEIRQMVNGPESFTPDGHYLLGSVTEIENYYVACGMNSSGIVSSAGVGRALAEWIENKEPTMDLRTVDIKRFSRHHGNKTYLRDVVVETIAHHYKLPYPLDEIQTVRGIKCSPLHDQLDSYGASWGNVMGWERPEWFSRDGEDPKGGNDTFGKPRWFDNMKVEVEACTKRVGVVDTSASLTIEISGDSALALMQSLCSNNMDVPVGKIVRTLMLNSKGGIKAFCTIYRLDNDRFLLVDSIKQSTTTLHWVSSHAKRFTDVEIMDVTCGYSGLSVVGPASESVLQSITQSSLNVENFPLNSVKKIDVAYAVDVLVARKKNEWNLFMLPEHTRNVYNEVMKAGSEHEITNVGHHALESLRIEQGVPSFGSDLGYSVLPQQVGLEALVDLEKFKGSERVSSSATDKRLVHLTIHNHDDDNFPWGGEPVLHNDVIVGMTTSASYGFLGDKPVAMAFVTLPLAVHGASYAWFTLVPDGRRSIVFSSNRQNILHANDHRQWTSPILTTSVNQALEANAYLCGRSVFKWKADD